MSHRYGIVAGMPKTILTHDGGFHADDVFAVATLLLLDADAAIVRTREKDRIAKADIVVDVGDVYDEAQNRFDHHQTCGAGLRKDTVPYAAFGLVWKKFGETLCGDSEIAFRVEETLVVPVDANDNGVSLALPTTQSLFPYEISDAIHAFVPTWREEGASYDSSFSEAVSFAKKLLLREIKRAEAVVYGGRAVEEIYRSTLDKRLVVLPDDYSWKNTLAHFPEPFFCVHPKNGGWRLSAVRDNPRLFVNRKDLPKKWAGLRDAELTRITGVPDAVFCHRNRFMAAARSKEGALALAKLALSL